MKPRPTSEGSSALRRRVTLLQARLNRAAMLEIWLVVLVIFSALLLANRYGGP